MSTHRLIALLLVFVCFVSAVVGLRNQRVLRPPSQENHLEIVRLNGAISSDPTTLEVRDRLLAIAEEDNVKGVLLAINSPGGSVAASQEIYQAVRRVREKKPVYVSMLDVAASGGYYVASAADRIYANDGTLTGSIGVILSGFNVGKLLERLGVEPQTLKTGPYKDIFSPYRKLSDSERELLQGLIQDTYEKFVADVAAGRKLDPKVVRAVADGRVFSGRQAVQNKLVDAIGTESQVEKDLRAAAREKFGLPESEKLPLRESPPSFDRLLQRFLQGRLKAWAPPQFPSLDTPILLMPSWSLPQEFVVYSELGKSWQAE
ncbi:MAG: signal peptide peptidase SppA [Pseudanabaenaceae cyanobacterium]